MDRSAARALMDAMARLRPNRNERKTLACFRHCAKQTIILLGPALILLAAKHFRCGRARNIKQSSQPVPLTAEQRERLRTLFSTAGGPKMDRPNFEMMIGTAAVAGKNLVIVDQSSRRVAAIIADVR
jgi:hypothetical protein